MTLTSQIIYLHGKLKLIWNNLDFTAKFPISTVLTVQASHGCLLEWSLTRAFNHRVCGMINVNIEMRFTMVVVAKADCLQEGCKEL